MIKKALLLAMMLILFSPPAKAELKMEFGSTKISIDGMSLLLPEPIHISQRTGMVPVRLLLMQSGHKLLALNEESSVELLAKTYGRQAIDDAMDRFEKPLLILNQDDTLHGVMGIGSKLIKIGDELHEMPAKTYIREGLFFAPVRPLCKHLGLAFLSDGKSIRIFKEKALAPPKKWTDFVLEKISLESLLLVCFGVVVFLVVLFFILTPLRRLRANRG